MPISARCPNPTCGQTLQVPDQYAGAQGKCPSCGTMVHFPQAAAAPPPPPAPAPPALPPAVAPAYPPAGAPPDAYPAAPGAYAPPALPGQPYPAAGPAMSTPQLMQMICMPVGLFFLFLLIVCTFLPWAGAPTGDLKVSGVRLGDAGIFLVLCLFIEVVAGLTYLFKGLLPAVAAIAAGFGILALFIMLGAVVEYGGLARVGVWLGLFAALGTAGAFVTLAVFRPVESSALHALKLPLMKPHGGLVIAVAVGIVVGFLYMILSAVSSGPYGPRM